MKYKIKTEIFENFIKENNLSTAQFCKMCKISPCTFKNIMNNDFDFCISALFKIEKVINVQVFQMFK